MRTALIPAGGTGRRMMPLTSVIPKPLLPVNMKAALHYIVDECVSSGISRVGIVTKYRAQDITDYFRINDFPEFGSIEIEFIPQGEGWGMVDALSVAEDFVGGEDFALLLADDIVRSETPAIRQLMEVTDADYVLGCEDVDRSVVHRYGAVVPREPGRVFEAARIVEKPKTDIGTGTVIAGRYILDSRIFDRLGTMESGRVSITDAIAEELDDGAKVRGRIIDGVRYDLGSPDGYRRAFWASVEEGWE